MKVQTKITLLLLAVVAIFIAGLWAFRAFDQEKFREIRTSRLVEAKRGFDTFLRKDGEPLETLADYDTTWDDMVRAIQSKNTKWLSDNVSSETLLGYKAYAVWIYDRDVNLIYSRSAIAVDPEQDKAAAGDRNNAVPAALPIPREAFDKLFAKGPAAHFFVKLDGEVMEIRGATVHGSKDYARQTPQQGFFFVGRLWNGPPLEEMSLFSNTKLSLAPPEWQPRETVEDGLIIFSKTLSGWDGQPVAHLIVKNEMAVVRLLNQSN